jgi:DMSO reductase family type II enzyme molybdopterin subunit
MNECETEQVYRRLWRWDKAARTTHCVDCYPGNCPYLVFLKDGEIVGSEQAGSLKRIETGVPDLNPMGCQKGAAWHLLLQGRERVLQPLKRAGERGEGKWQAVSWEQALTEIADHMLDAIEEIGPEAIIHEGTPAEGGLLAGMPFSRVAGLLGGVRTDVNAVINDNSPGTYLTYGKFDPVIGADDLFHSELVIFAHTNPAYTQIPTAHIATEARYNGTEVVLVAPDCSPSHVHTDYFVPVKPATDAALALGMANVIVGERLYNAGFIREQTDLPLLVRRDNGLFLRASDLEEGGREDPFYVWDASAGALAEAPRGTLSLGHVEPALEGEYRVELKDGSRAKVTPAFEVLKRRLEEYTPERASAVCGTHPDVIRALARKAASKRTAIIVGMTANKYYHGDLMLRSYLLVLALTGNWGKQGTGSSVWSVAGFDGPFMYGMKQKEGVDETLRLLQMMEMVTNAFRQQDPTMTGEMAHINLLEQMAASGGGAGSPPAFLWYYHWGYRDDWNRSQWNDPTMIRPFDEYVKESLDRGWWQGVAHPGESHPPRVYIEVGGNAVRRTRGGLNRLLRSFWPQLRCIVSVDWRMTSTGMFSDYVLPAAHHFEKLTFPFANPWTMNVTIGDRLVEPAGDTRSEASIALLLAQKIEERARAREMFTSRDAGGVVRRLDDFATQYTSGGAVFVDEEQIGREWVEDSAAMGNLPSGTTLETLRERGYVRSTGWGKGPIGCSQASDIKPDETHNPFRWHTEDKVPYPTLTRRAQFYIDHPWFIEADEALPRHKDDPPQGGDGPYVLTSGHNRWSIHSMNITDRLMLQTHRGAPHVVINDGDAAALGVEDGDGVEVSNELGAFTAAAKVSPSVRPGQVVSYNGWEPYMYRGWQTASDLEPGMVKWLHFAGGYGHLKYRPLQWQPVPFDRGVRVEVKRVAGLENKGTRKPQNHGS